MREVVCFPIACHICLPYVLLTLTSCLFITSDTKKKTFTRNEKKYLGLLKKVQKGYQHFSEVCMGTSHIDMMVSFIIIFYFFQRLVL